MKFSDFAVDPAKVDALRRRIAALGLDLAQVQERFIKGGGPGGQKINKTASCVQLTYAPMDLVIRCQESRQRSLNRFLALRRLVEEIEFRRDPATSEKGKRIAKLRERKRQKSRHRTTEPTEGDGAHGDQLPV